MDEENNEQGQEIQETEDTAQKIQEEAQDTAQGVKDGASLAKNATSGNIAGATKDAVNLAKNKTLRKKMIIKTALSILAPILLVLIIALSIEALFDAIGDAVQSTLETKEFFNLNLNDLEITITEEALDKMIEKIEEQGISLDDLHLMGDKADYNDPEVEEKNQEALRKYLRQFYIAQAVTQTLNPGESLWDKLSGKIYGTVFVQRADKDDVDLSKVTQLEYIPYEKMVEKQNKANDEGKIGDIMNYFSINPENEKLVIANTTTTTIDVKNGSKTEEKFTGLTEVDYKSVISEYTTSMNFFVYLTMITQNPEFASAVADLVKDSDIRITIMDRETTSITKEEREYTLNTKWIAKVPHIYSDHVGATHTEYTYEEKSNSEDKTETTETTVVSTTPDIAVTYAKTWFSEQTIEYIKEDNPIVYDESYSTDPINEEEPSISGEGDVAEWITNDTTTVTSGSGSKQYKQENRGEVKSRIGEKPDQDPSYESFIDLLDKKFKIPNVSRVENESAAGNLISGAELFFSLLQKDANSQNLENIMRYALYIYTGRSYGITDMGFLQAFDVKEFQTVSGISGSSVEEKVWIALLNAGYSKYAAAGVLGNLSAESGGFSTPRSNNLEDTSNKKCGLSDEQFTEMVNSGAISREEFISSPKYSTSSKNGWKYGYGLAQWTSKGRKTGLYDFAQNRGVSIDDEDMQIEYLMKEITGSGADGFGSRVISANKGFTVSDWTDATSASAAAEAFCWIFERPEKWNSKRATKAEEYYKLFNNLGLGGTYKEDEKSEYGVIGYYESSRGRIFTILHQNRISGWDSSCNKAACAIIASGYSDESSNELIANINRAKLNGIPPNGSSYWNGYGLAVTYIEENTKTYKERLRNQLKSGGYAIVKLNIKPNQYYGKSGERWTKGQHYIAILDYRQKDGVEQMCTADWRGIRWVGLDEFEENGIMKLFFINEK